MPKNSTTTKKKRKIQKTNKSPPRKYFSFRFIYSNWKSLKKRLMDVQIDSSSINNKRIKNNMNSKPSLRHGPFLRRETILCGVCKCHGLRRIDQYAKVARPTACSRHYFSVSVNTKRAQCRLCGEREKKRERENSRYWINTISRKLGHWI